ncbi:related to URK1 [Phialocephala subalpina]|uniref:Related to URK1 n=1 Tax=Phialocephala subalpina TaxID=576137 RepID=A0A1L7X6A0_9HELO|nr:related to URK1 [Phialocephala subalpina]
MASTRESSPARSEAGTASPGQLTPTSKVKAMLAALDNDSDDESLAGAVRSKLVASIMKTPTKPANAVDTMPSQERVEATKAAEASSEDDEEILRPKGRMAARMQAEQNSSEEDVAPAVDVRERVRKMLAARSRSPSPASNADNNDEGQDSDVPVVPRKRKIRQGRRETPKSSPVKGPASPSLFVSPRRHGSASPPRDRSDSDDLPEDPIKDDRFMALVAKKRQERQARDAEAAKEKAKKAAEKRRYTEMLHESDDDSDDEGGRRLTQQTRPTRKASKRAIEEINRESQRISRNQQLAHQAVTKKKITKESLFARFNFRGTKQGEGAEELPRPSSSSSAAPHSDVEAKDTPPTSPASQHSDDKDVAIPIQGPAEEGEDDADLPTLEEALTSSPPRRLDKGKGRAIEEPVAEPIQEVVIPKKPIFPQRPIRIRPPKPADRTISPMDDSDSDLEIVAAKTPKLKKKLDAMFDNVPANQQKESHALHVQRMLAHLSSPGKKNVGRNKKPSMTTTELEMSLQQRARQQAVREREERLDALRAKGIIIQTAEEREREMVDVDDILAAARREQDELAKREKAAAKKERKDNGEVDLLGDSSDDEDWEESKDEKKVLDDELAISGSEDEEGDDESGEDAGEESGGEEEDEDAMALDDEENEAAAVASKGMFDNEASESDDDEAEAEAEASADEEMTEGADANVVEDEEEQLPAHRRTRKLNIISDDEEEEDSPAEKRPPLVTQVDSPLPPKTDSPMAPNSVLRSATKTFIPGLTVAGPAGLGLTQIFAGTMDESQMDSYEPSQTAPRPASPQFNAAREPMAFLKRFAAPELPPFMPTMSEDTQDIDDISPSQATHIPESQPTQGVSQGVDLHFSQSQVHEFDSLVEDTQMSPFVATQDAGFQDYTPIKGRFMDVPPSTVETVVLEPTAVPETMQETPIVKRKGKLRRRAPQVAAFSDEEDAGEPAGPAVDEDDFEITANVFDVMKKASKKKVVVDEFDKRKSDAKGMVHEQAEESEDEYAGLGGASDDESGGEEDAYVKEMIDDEAGKNVDESKLAAFYADRERASDEKQVEKLFKDITNGMLRRKRGADLDLSDSDDGGEAKKRRKRKEFAKMRKALLADERIGKIAENPKRQAFLRALEDRGSEDEMDFLDDFAEQEDSQDSQSQSQTEGSQQVVPDSQPTEMGPPKRKRSDDAEEAANRPPPHLRRTKPAKKPTNISEIRESLSSLIEEPNAIIAPADYGSDSDDDLEIEDEHDLNSGRVKEKENRDPFALRRTNTSVIDRISLKRQSSSSTSTSAKLAFTVSSATSGFKVPLLLRRATTNNSIASSTSSSVSGGMSGTERMAGGAGSEGVRRGGGKGSGINYFTRESERRAAVAKREGRREQKLVKGAQVRAKVVGGLFGGGKFE